MFAQCYSVTQFVTRSAVGALSFRSEPVDEADEHLATGAPESHFVS